MMLKSLAMGVTKIQVFMISIVACTILFVYAVNLLGLPGFRHFVVTLGKNIAGSKVNIAMFAARNQTTIAEKQRRVVLVYTTFFGQRKWLRVSKTCFRGTPCSMDTFEVTYDKERIDESEFVVFHARNMPGLDHLKLLSKIRRAWQWWVYFLMESPNATPNTQPLNGLFNLTWTYRSDSDLLVPYGSYVELFNGTENSNAVSGQDFSKGKSKLVAWMVSNCGPGLRKQFAHELKKYVQVDVFGGCSRQFGEPQGCPGQGRSCPSILSEYKFYLSFENALCEDYITEKYWHRLGENFNVVPVVLGGGNYTKLAIPGSYVNVMDFKTVKQLAEYLQYLDKNSTAYNEYFKWRQKYRVEIAPEMFPCQFCYLFNKANPPQQKVYSNLKDFWVTQGKCNQKDAIVRKMFQN